MCVSRHGGTRTPHSARWTAAKAGAESLWLAPALRVLTGDMGFTIEGDYVEACNCEVSCPCVFLAPATEDTCHLFIAWRINRGEKDGVDLSGLNTVLAVHAPRQMTDGNWRVALYLDDSASAQQR